MSSRIKKFSRAIRGWYYFRFTTSTKIKGRNNRINCAGSDLIDCKIVIKGNDNVVIIEKGCKLWGTKINVIGDHNTIHIESDCRFRENCQLNVEDRKSKINIGCGTTATDMLIISNEGCSIDIGEDCMIGKRCEIRNSDGHSIFDENHKRINSAANIIIGEHVWIGGGTYILKGSRIGSGSVVGARSLVNSQAGVNTVSVGIPSQIIRKGVTWSRSREKILPHFGIKNDLKIILPSRSFVPTLFHNDAVPASSPNYQL